MRERNMRWCRTVLEGGETSTSAKSSDSFGVHLNIAVRLWANEDVTGDGEERNDCEWRGLYASVQVIA
jgi:hypothetical protein